MRRNSQIIALILAAFARVALAGDAAPTTDDGTWFVIGESEAALPAHHTKHAEAFGKYVTGYNSQVLAGVDKVQSSKPEGGGYFAGVKAKPAESPIGYSLALFGQPLLSPLRTTSYCSGSSYSAFIESLNLILPDGAKRIDPDHYESLRMQERDGGRREDGVKFWGHWNDDGPGCQYALVQYCGAGAEIRPIHARPGDFMNINWTSGLGHSVVFLGWYKDADGKKFVRFWSSQKGTNGLGDQTSPLEKIESVKVVRLTKPEKIFDFEIKTLVNRKISCDKIDW